MATGEAAATAVVTAAAVETGRPVEGKEDISPVTHNVFPSGQEVSNREDK